MIKKERETRRRSVITRTAVGFAAVIALALSFFAQYVWFPDGWPLDRKATPANKVSEIAPVSRVLISEVMSANRGAWPGTGGLYPDWAELYNAGNTPADITGWTLTDNANRHIQFTFPEMSLAAGQCVVVSLTGNLKNEQKGDLEAPFRLSATGDALLLYDAGGAIMEATNIPPLAANQVYARIGSSGDFFVSNLYTPGLVNTSENHQAMQLTTGQSESLAIISELMADNDTTLKDSDGDYSDYIELKNTGEQAVDLSDYGLSDNPTNLYKWRLPGITLGAGETLRVFASGKDRHSGELHTNFRLNAEGETVTLTDAAGKTADQVSYRLLKADQRFTIH